MSSGLDERLARLSSCDDVDELLDLGCDLADVDRQPDAERCFRRAASLGSPTAEFNLGNTLAAQQRWDEAVPAYLAAVAGGENDAWLNLGNALQELGDLVGAMDAFREAARTGDSNGALALAFCLRELGERELAVIAAREAAEAGNMTARGVLACWEWNRTLDPELEAELRIGADFYASARAALADLLRSTDRFDEARRVLEHGADLGEVDCWLPLGNLYSDGLGDLEAAEAAYRCGIAAGDAHCHNNLGVLLAARGEPERAEEQFKLGVSAGDSLAARSLRNLLDP